MSLYEILMEFSNPDEDSIITRCKILQFIRNNKAQHFISKFNDVNQFTNELTKDRDYQNKLIFEENKKRNIQPEQSILYNFNGELKDDSKSNKYQELAKNSIFKMQKEYTFMCVF